MGVDTKLYINSKYDLNEIRDVIERTQHTEVKVIAHDSKGLLGYYYFQFKKRQIWVCTNAETPIGTATYLSLSCNDEAHQIFKDIAQVLGGVFMDNDMDGKLEFINGNMYDDDGLPYFIKYAIVHDGINPDDLSAFLQSKKEWHERIGS